MQLNASGMPYWQRGLREPDGATDFAGQEWGGSSTGPGQKPKGETRSVSQEGAVRPSTRIAERLGSKGLAGGLGGERSTTSVPS